jgi:hypothetical protein
MKGEKEKVPYNVQSDRDWRQALRQGVVFGHLLDYIQNFKKGCDDNNSCHKSIVGDVCHVFGLTSLF